MEVRRVFLDAGDQSIGFGHAHGKGDVVPPHSLVPAALIQQGKGASARPVPQLVSSWSIGGFFGGRHATGS